MIITVQPSLAQVHTPCWVVVCIEARVMTFILLISSMHVLFDSRVVEYLGKYHETVTNQPLKPQCNILSEECSNSSGQCLITNMQHLQTLKLHNNNTAAMVASKCLYSHYVEESQCSIQSICSTN